MEGNLTRAEATEFEEWTRANPQAYYELVELHYTITKGVGKDSPRKIHKEELYRRFDFVQYQQRKKRRDGWLKYAAIFIGLMAAVGIYIVDNDIQLMSGQNAMVVTEEDITISSGKQAKKQALDENGSGIVSSSKAFVATQIGSKLKYKRLEGYEVDQDQMEYNTLEVPFGKRFALELSDGTEIQLNSGSSITYPVVFNPSGARQVELRGEAYFSVTSDSLRPFIVNTSSVETEVLGTEFNISSYPDEEVPKVVLVEGSVQVSSTKGLDNSQHILLKPSEMATYTEQDNAFRVEEVDVSLYVVWKEGVLLFRNEDFEHIVLKLERRYNMDIEIQDETLKTQQYSGRFEKETIEEVLQGFQRIKQFEYTSINDKKIVLTQINQSPMEKK